MRKVLIIDDDPFLCTQLQAVLTKNLNCECDTASRLVLARNLLREYDYDMVILDRDLPDGDGLELVRRRFGITPASQYLVLSNWGSLPDRERGLSEGVFEYLSKPFSQIELIEKAKRLLMANGRWRSDCIKIDRDVYFFPVKAELVVDGHPKALRRTDADLLAFLAQGGIISCQQLREGLWRGEKEISNNAIAIRISRLRNKLGQYGQRLKTFYRVGYQLQLATNAMIDTRMI